MRMARDVPPGELGEIGFAVARTRWEAGEREPALREARAAREVLSRGEGLDRRLLPEVETWLARREATAAATPARAQ